MKKGRDILFLLILVLVLILMNYDSWEGFVVKNVGNEELVHIERVIDGDTVVVNGTSIRMLGLNTPEKGEKYYAEAKNYTSSFVMNKTVKIERRGFDLYDRELAYLFDIETGKNINEELIRKGYANAYFPEERDNYYESFMGAWEECIANNKNLCKKSSDKCAECIEIHKFGPEEDLILYNSCDFNCNLSKWSIKDEGRKRFVFSDFILKSNNQVTITAEDFGQDYVWTNTGDTMFLRDEKGELVLWETY
ncbi:MAG: thermonuclease family protein [Nanobdellota archaeon]